MRQLSHPEESRHYIDTEERVAHPSPAKLLKFYTIVFGAAHALACGILYSAIISARPGWAIWFWVVAGIPPLFVWAAYRDCLVSWQGRPIGYWESLVPVIVVGGLGCLGYWAFH